MVCRVPVEQGTADFHYAEADGSVELPRLQVTQQYGSNDMARATGLFHNSLKHIQAQQPAGLAMQCVFI